MRKFSVQTSSKQEFVNITSQIEKEVRAEGISKGVCTIFIPHTTSGVTINESADPHVKEDIQAQLSKLVPQSGSYKHAEGNSPAHIKSSLIGSSEKILIEDGKLRLGTWQGVFFCEFDGPRRRNVWLNFVG